MKKLCLLAGLILSISVIAAGCSLSGSSTSIKIGVSAPLTGEGASWGQNTLAAVNLAVKEVNDAGGIDGKKVELIAEDDKAGGIDAVNAFNKLINIDKVVGIVGVPSSAAAGPALPIAQTAKIPVVMLASAPSLTSIGDYIFRVYPSDSYQGYVGADLVYSKLDKKKVAILFVNNDYGQGVSQAFVKKYNELGGEIAYQGALNNDSKDFRSEITKAMASKPDSLYLVMYPDGALILGKQLKEAGNKLPVVTDTVFNDEVVVKSGYSNGFIYAEPKSAISEDFITKIKSQPEFKDLSVMVAAPFSYDATKALLTAIINAKSTDSAKIKDALSKVLFDGVSSPKIEFDSSREIKNPAFNIMIVENKKAVPYNK